MRLTRSAVFDMTMHSFFRQKAHILGENESLALRQLRLVFLLILARQRLFLFVVE